MIDLPTIACLAAVICAVYMAVSQAVLHGEHRKKLDNLLDLEQASYTSRKQLLEDEWESQRKIFERNDYLLAEQMQELPKRLQEAITECVSRYRIPYQEENEEFVRQALLRDVAAQDADLKAAMEGVVDDAETRYRKWEAGI